MKQSSVISLILGSAIVVVAAARLFLALTRYFDVDEFAYLHWSYLLSTGATPYRDFFLYITPLFPWLLKPLFFFPSSATILLAARLFEYALYLTTTYFLYRLSAHMTSHQPIRLLAILIFITFPMTFDKTIEIRPDIFMTLLFLMAVNLLLEIKIWKPSRLLLIGILIDTSLVAFQKIIFAMPAVLWLLWGKEKANKVRHILLFTVGLAIPFVLFTNYLLSHNLLGQAVTAIFVDSVAVNAGKLGFSPLQALAPFPLVYLTQGGITIPWLVNTGIWIAGALGLWILWKTHRHLSVFFLLFFTGGIVFLFLFPAPYVQYFVPLSAGASILAAHSIQSPKKASYAPLLLAIALLFSFFLQYRERVLPGAKNDEQLHVVRDILTISHPTESVYDMVGSFVFRRDGYFICCHPYGEFINHLKNQPPTLTDSLIQNQTKFIVLDRTGLVFWQTPQPDLSFLLTHYLPSSYPKIYTSGVQFRCQDGTCTQHDMSNTPLSPTTNTFTLVATDTYHISIEPPHGAMTIDDKIVNDSDIAFFNTGRHTYTVLLDVTSFRIQLDR